MNINDIEDENYCAHCKKEGVLLNANSVCLHGCEIEEEEWIYNE